MIDRVGIFGLGDVLMGDYGVGPEVISALKKSCMFEEAVEIRDLGTSVDSLVNDIVNLDALIIIDSVELEGAKPGDLHICRRDDILARSPRRAADSETTQPGEQAAKRPSDHDPTLRDAIKTAEFRRGKAFSILLVGINPGNISLSMGLSPAVKDAIPKAINEVLDELKRLGHPASEMPF